MPIFSGFALIPHSETSKPSNFPHGTPNAHFDGLSLISYLLKLANRAGKKARSSRAKQVARDSAQIDSNSKNNESSRALV